MKQNRWTFEKLQEEALKYKTRANFAKDSPNAYMAATRRKILDQICSHMVSAYDYWTLEKIQLEAIKYKTRYEFQLLSKNAYNAAYIRNLLDVVCSHMLKMDMTGSNAPNYYWTDEMLKIEALKYKTRRAFQVGNKGAYLSAFRRGILDIVCSHMPKHVDQSGENHPMFKWTYEEIYTEAIKYSTRYEFQKFSNKAYKAAILRGVLNEVCSHMKKSSNSSFMERELMNILRKVFPDLINKNFKVNVSDKPYIRRFQVDGFDPNTSLGIEFDGKYHHSEKYLIKSKAKYGWSAEDAINYHSIKDNALWDCHGIKILHIKEEDWLNNKELCIKKCLDFLSNNFYLKQRKLS